MTLRLKRDLEVIFIQEGKKNIIAGLIQEYDIKTVEDIQEALKDLLGGTIQEMMEAQFDEFLAMRNTNAVALPIIETE